MEFHNAKQLIDRGVIIPAPQSVYVDAAVSLDRIAPGVVLYPGARVSGAETVLAEGAAVGTQGPANIENVALGRGAKIVSGTAEGACLLAGASLGPNSHVRSGTLLEEDASTGHGVGLKQTIVLSFVTLGSQINFCDCFMAGGTSRSDHSEVGSGFIHFNFTPFGKKGDKATASLFGDVCTGVFLQSPRIFLGGSGGVVGPIHVDYGTTLAAGSVYRRDYGGGLLVYGEKTIAKSRAFDPLLVRRVGQRTKRCLRYMGELRALYAWYRDVRLGAQADEVDRLIVESAMKCIAEGIKERRRQVNRFLEGACPADDEAKVDLDQTRSHWESIEESFAVIPEPDEAQALKEAFLQDIEPQGDHVAWVQGLGPSKVEQGKSWLRALAQPGSSQSV